MAPNWVGDGNRWSSGFKAADAREEGEGPNGEGKSSKRQMRVKEEGRRRNEPNEGSRWGLNRAG
jgi:hypothetical protein